MKSILVIHHSADFDGLFCCEIARKFYGDKAEYLGWDYKDSSPVVSPNVREIIMLDISIDALMGDPRLTWIDHHKTAIDKYPASIPGYRIDGVAACRLAWQWFIGSEGRWQFDWPLPLTKDEYVDRKVSEPYAVRLAGEYDTWDKRDPTAELFQHGLRSQELTSEAWDDLLTVGVEHGLHEPATASERRISELLRAGEVVQFTSREAAKRTCENGAFSLHWEGLHWLALNSGGNSLTFESAEKPEHDGLLMFRWATDRWLVSLYHAKAHTEHDLSAIASKYGGGGHRGACGFNCKTLPFPL